MCPAGPIRAVSQPLRNKVEGKDFILIKSPDFGPSRTKQSFKNEVDINQIVARALSTGQPPESSSGRRPVGGGAPFGVAPAVGDLKSALDFVRDSRARFSSLAPVIQRRFGSPERLVDFLAQPVNYREAVDLGLFDPNPALDAKLAAKAAGGPPKGGPQADAPKEPPKAS